MSFDDDALPPFSAPLAERLKAAMARSEKYGAQRALAAALGTDGSLVGKWLHGDVKRITSAEHLRKLPELLGTPPGYFASPPAQARMDRLEEQVAALRTVLVSLADAAKVDVPDVLRQSEEQAL